MNGWTYFCLNEPRKKRRRRRGEWVVVNARREPSLKGVILLLQGGRIGIREGDDDRFCSMQSVEQHKSLCLMISCSFSRELLRASHTHTQTYVCSFQSRFLFAARQGGRMLLWRKSSYRRRPLIVVVFFLCCCYIPFRLFRLLILGWEWRWPQDLRWLKLIRCVNGP